MFEECSRGALKIYRKSLHRQMNNSDHLDEEDYIFIIIGASGDLAKKKIYPALWYLHRDNLSPQNTTYCGYSRSEMSILELKEKTRPHLIVKDENDAAWENFWQRHVYFSGSYDKQIDFEILNEKLTKLETTRKVNRIFYLALPPSVFESVTENLSKTCKSLSGWTRIIIEKPFGKDAESSAKLTKHLASIFNEQQIYRIDHYLGKEMVQNLMVLRFGNRFFAPSWNRGYIASIQITFKECIGTHGRAGYFDEFGIIRDVMQNHLLQILSLVTMEKPASIEPDDIRNEKVKVLKSIPPVKLEDMVLGQYIGDPNGKDEAKLSYRDDKFIPNDSKTATYAAAVLRINNEQWEGVPIILKCGKALNERKTEIRIQYNDVPGDIFHGKTKRNELVIRVQPGEAIYLKLMNKTPGLAFEMEESELDLTYGNRYKGINLPDAYDRLLLDVFTGSQIHFVRSDELQQAWRIFSPVLKEIENKGISPYPYMYGSRGPVQTNDLLKKYNFKYYGSYKWSPPSN